MKNIILIVGVMIVIGGAYMYVSANSIKKPVDSVPSTNDQISPPTIASQPVESIELVDGAVSVSASRLNDATASFFTTTLTDGSEIEFFILQDSAGVYRAAANACQVCFAAHQGFHQEGNDMVCNTCGNHYPLEKIATEKGGCNPGPINPNLKVVDGQIIITESELAQVKDLF